MLDILEQALAALPEFLDDEHSLTWHSLAVRYETPHVNRLWWEWGDYRINLHKIFPCETALWHPHPWPSAVKIFSGSYEMGLAYGDEKARYTVARTILCEGSCYTMTEQLGWHYVRPIGEPSMSVMVTGKPWDTGNAKHPGKGISHDPLRDRERWEILEFFQKALSVSQP